MILEVTVNGRDYRVEVEPQQDGGWSCRVNDEDFAVNVANTSTGVLSLLIDGESFEVISNITQRQIAIAGARYSVEVRDPRSWRARRARAGADMGPRSVIAPMPGKVVRVVAPAGSQVEQGAGVIVIEAMKMQNELKSPKKGRVAKIVATEGSPVNAGEVLAVIE